MIFPTEKKPSNNFWEPGAWSFGARRDGGKRKHAGVDLYLPEGTPIVAMCDSMFIYALPFYLETSEVVLESMDEIVFRYGEIETDLSAERGGDIIKKGEIIGYVKQCIDQKTKKPVAEPMLHFELYDKLAKFPLTRRDNPPYKRTTGLIDPTVMLSNLYQKK